MYMVLYLMDLWSVDTLETWIDGLRLKNLRLGENAGILARPGATCLNKNKRPQ